MRGNKFKLSGSVLALLLVPSVAYGQSQVQPVVVNGTTASGALTTCPVGSGATAACPLPVSGTFSAAIAGFHPVAGATANLASVTTASSDVALPAGADIVVTNTGAADVQFRITTGAGTAVTTDQTLKSGAATGLHLSGETHISAITKTGSSSLNIQGGSGLASGYGGGGSSSGSSTVAIDQTTPGTTNGVYVNNTPSVNATIVAPFGSAVSASSIPVVVASDQAAIPVTSGVAQGSTTSGQTGALVQGAVTTAAPTYSNATTRPLSLDVAGNTRTLDSQSGTWTVQPGNTPNTAPWLVQAVPGTATGLSFATITAANSTNATNLKNAAGQLYHITAYNNSATLAWVSFYNTAGTPTCGTGIVYQAMIPANSTSGAGVVEDIADGLTFTTGIGYCITTGIAGTGSVAATSYVVNFGYR